MPSIQDDYAGSSNYLKAEDLKGQVVKVKIAGYERLQFEKGTKAVLSFEGKQKKLVLNKTNALMIADTFGEDYNDWIGGEIELFATKTTYEGKLVPALRVQVPRQTQTPTPTVRMAPNARDRARETEPNPPAPLSEVLDDEIPF